MKNISRMQGVSSRRSFGKSDLFRCSGLTLMELAVVIFAILLLATVVMTGARAWKRGSDRAACILNLQAVQKAIRGYGNMHGFVAGDSIVGLEMEVIGPGQYFNSIPECPAGGTYTLGGNFLPPIGTLYMTCSLSGTDLHEPDNPGSW